MKSHPILTSLVFSIVASVVVSCEKPAAPTAAPVQESVLKTSDVPVLKISPGDQWTYKVTVENPQDIRSGKPAVASFERVRKFLGPIDPGGGHPPTDCFEVSAAGAKTMREFVKITPEEVLISGQAIVGEDGVQTNLIWLSEPMTFYRAGLAAGDSLPMAVLNNDEDLWRVIRVIAREKVLVPAGEFDSVRLQMFGKDGDVSLRRTYWFKPGEGLIREEKVREVDGKPVFLETEELIAIKRSGP